MDVGDSELVYTVEQKEEDNFVASENEMDSKETEPKENEAASRSSFSEPGSTSESERELKVEVKTEEELNEENVSVKDDSSEKSPAGPDVSEETNMDKTSEELTHAEEKMDPDVDTEEDVSAQQQEESSGSKLRVSTADDLDEMMDIGTVDQVEQEAQMKEEQQENSAMDVDGSRSPSSSNTGKIKVCV